MLKDKYSGNVASVANYKLQRIFEDKLLVEAGISAMQAVLGTKHIGPPKVVAVASYS
jgi:hypothetical protein